MEIINHKGKHYLKTETGYREILASTDKSLKIKEYTGVVDESNGVKEFWEHNLPQPPQDFINYFVEEYNKGNVIEWVNVEYEVFGCIKSNTKISVEGSLHYIELNDGEDKTSQHLKVNSKNEITVKPIKNSWNREEIKSILTKFKDSPNRAVDFNIDKWISENL